MLWRVLGQRPFSTSGRPPRGLAVRPGLSVGVAEVELRFGESLVCGLSIPAHRFGLVLWHPLAYVIGEAEVELRPGVPWSAAFLYQRVASALSFDTPLPLSYATPRSNCAMA